MTIKGAIAKLQKEEIGSSTKLLLQFRNAFLVFLKSASSRAMTDQIP
jgi:hypothetical protein